MLTPTTNTTNTTTKTPNSYCLKCLKKLKPIKADSEYNNWNRKFHKKCYLENQENQHLNYLHYKESGKLNKYYNEFIIQENMNKITNQKIINTAIKEKITPLKMKKHIETKYLNTEYREKQKSIFNKVLQEIRISYKNKPKLNPQLIKQTGFEYFLLPCDIKSIIRNKIKDEAENVKRYLYCATPIGCSMLSVENETRKTQQKNIK